MVRKQVLATFPCRLRRRMRISMPATLSTARSPSTLRREHRIETPGACSTKPAFGLLLAR
jgi:hypothetical protein